MKIYNIIFTCILSGVFLKATAQDTNTKNYNLQGQLAIQGYDPVAYFVSNKAIKGDSKIKSIYQQVSYQFVSESNKTTFLANPSKYVPQYGGWCAYAMGVDGSKVKIDPETYKIIDGKLYLFYNFYFTNTLPKWNEDEAKLKLQADQFWGKLK